MLEQFNLNKANEAIKIIIFVRHLFLPFTGYSCDCVSMVGLKEAKSVFNGKVLSVIRIEQPYIFYRVEFKVEQYIKGKKRKCHKSIKVNVPSLQEGGCGIPFKVGDKYLVYTYIEDKMLFTSNCTETRKIE